LINLIPRPISVAVLLQTLDAVVVPSEIEELRRSLLHGRSFSRYSFHRAWKSGSSRIRQTEGCRSPHCVQHRRIHPMNGSLVKKISMKKERAVYLKVQLLFPDRTTRSAASRG
jgi:hypothetical protein